LTRWRSENEVSATTRASGRSWSRRDGRLGREQAQLLHHFIEVGGYGLALEEIAGPLAQDRVAVSDQERGDMLALGRRMKMDDQVPRALRFCPRATEPG